MSENFRKNKKENEYIEWFILFEVEFTKFHDRVKTELEKTDVRYQYDGSKLEKLNESFQRLKSLLMLTAEERKIAQQSLSIGVNQFLDHLKEVDKLVKEKVCDTLLKSIIERLRALFCKVVNCLRGDGHLVIVAEGVCLTSTDPKLYTVPKKSLSQASQKPHSLLFEVLHSAKETQPSQADAKVLPLSKR